MMLELYEWILLGVSPLPCFVIGALFVLTLKHADKKIIKASSPLLLYVILCGSQLLFSESILFICDVSAITCIVAVWCRHLGFFLIYGTILLKLWRVSVIIKSVKARLFQIKDSQLCKKLLVLLLACLLYLAVWTSTEAQFLLNQDHCPLLWWDVLIVCFELILLVFCGLFCFQTKQAPAIYNDSIYMGMAIWNEAIWMICYTLIRILLELYQSKELFQAIHILRTYLTCLPLLMLLFIPKFCRILSQQKEMHGVVTDVTNNRRIHKLSVVVNKNGDLRTIHCVPCGLLHWDGLNESVSAIQSPVHPCNDWHCENEYTREEVDKLIELLQQYKQENELLRQQSSQMLYIIQHNRLSLKTPVLENMTTTETPSIISSKIQQQHRQDTIIVNPLNGIDLTAPYATKGQVEDRYATLNINYEKRSVADITMRSCQAGKRETEGGIGGTKVEKFRELQPDSVEAQENPCAESYKDSRAAPNPVKFKALDVKQDFVDSGIMISGSALSPYKRPLCYRTLKTVYPQKELDLKVLQHSNEASTYTPKTDPIDNIVKPEMPIRDEEKQGVKRKLCQTVTNYELHI